MWDMYVVWQIFNAGPEIALLAAMLTVSVLITVGVLMIVTLTLATPEDGHSFIADLKEEHVLRRYAHGAISRLEMEENLRGLGALKATA